MDIFELLKKEIELIDKVYADKEEGENFVRVEVNSHKMADVIEVTKKANAFFDKHDYLNGNFYLDVFSKGTEEEMKTSDIVNNINEFVLVEVKEKVRDHNFLEGEILEADENGFKLRYNNKGQMLKLQIDYTNIVFIKKTAKIGRN